MPSGRGRKGAQAPRKRKKTEPASTRIDHLSCANAMVTSSTPSYNVSVTQSANSGLSVNISSLPGPSYSYQALPSLSPTGYTSWPIPTSPYDWSYPYMPVLPPAPSSQLPPAPPMAEENP